MSHVSPASVSAADIGSIGDEAVILDCRSPERFAAGHLPASGNIPTAELERRRHELPARDARIVVVADSAEGAALASQRLVQLGYERTSFLTAPLSDVPEGLTDRSPATRMWQASPYLLERLAHVPVGRAIDVAAGAGREAVHLAMQGFEVEAMDRAPEALERASALASRHGVSIRTLVIDLEKSGTPLPERSVGLVTVFRFLHRQILPWIEACVAPGGHLIYETFRRGQEAYGRPTHPRFLFWPGELEKAFPALEVLHYEELDPPGGPVMVRLHAHRPAS